MRTTDAAYAERSLVVPTFDQSIGLTRAGIPSTTPAAILSAAIDYLTDPRNGAVVLAPGHGQGEPFARVAKLLRRLGIPFRWARP